jgi:hypothetical protein
MKYFFPQAEDIPIDNSSINAEGYFRGANVTGLIEKQFNADRAAVLLYVSGTPSMAYVLENGQSKPILLAEFSSLNDDLKQVRAIKLPDVAGRLALLALESQTKHNYSIASAEAWGKQIDHWRQDQWNGLVEITSKKMHGFALFWQGESQKSDTIFSSAQGFVANLPEMNNTDDSAWDIVTYSPSTSAQVYQCTVLRHGAMHWSHGILSRYQEMVGLKLLQMMDRELNRQIQPWRWNIALNESDMVDSHFFAYINDAAHAYRALFMAMGAQMNIVIGNNLTQRLLNETFEQVHPDERAILQSQRLIPAAFSE